MDDNIKAPNDLSLAAAGHWEAIVSGYEDWTRADLLTLQEALRAWDRAEAARAIVNSEGVLVNGRFGQVPHPALEIERACRAQFLAALKQLHLEAPAERMTVSEAARRAALTRWHGKRPS